MRKLRIIIPLIFLLGSVSVYYLSPKIANAQCFPTPPDTPVLLSPTNGAITNPTVTLQWSPIANWGENCGATGKFLYYVVVNGVVIDLLPGTKTSFDFVGENGTTYNWRIIADNGLLKTTSGAWNFTVTGTPPPFGSARIVGRVWEDTNGDNSYGYTSELWTFEDYYKASECASYPNVFGPQNIMDVDTGGSSIFVGRGCNDGPPQEFYYTQYFDFPLGASTQNLSVFFKPPNDYACEDVTWDFRRCNVSGTGCPSPPGQENYYVENQPCANNCDNGKCEAQIPIGYANGPDWTNHLWWRIRKDIDSDVQGYLWKVPDGGSCSDNPVTNKFNAGDVDDIEPVTFAKAGIIVGVGPWEPENSSYSYKSNQPITNAPAGHTTATITVTPNSGENVTYKLACISEAPAGNNVPQNFKIDGSTAGVAIGPDDPTIIHFGFVKSVFSWFQTMAGDFFYKEPISMVLPDTPANGALPYLISGSGSAFSGGEIDVQEVTSGNTAIAEDDRYATELPSELVELDLWPGTWDGKPPTHADVKELKESQENLKSLSSDIVYTITVDEFNSDILSRSYEGRICGGMSPVCNPGTGYSTTSDDAIVIYITEAFDASRVRKTLRFTNKFQPSGGCWSGHSIVLITEANVVFDSSMQTIDRVGSSLGIGYCPSLGADGDITNELPEFVGMIITTGTITFESVGDIDGDGNSDDTPLLVQGPLVAKGGVNFERDLGLNNLTPATIVETSYIPLTKLVEEEIEKELPNFFGLSQINVSWRVEE
jgi:hypothetical protein